MRRYFKYVSAKVTHRIEKGRRKSSVEIRVKYTGYTKTLRAEAVILSFSKVVKINNPVISSWNDVNDREFMPLTSTAQVGFQGSNLYFSSHDPSKVERVSVKFELVRDTQAWLIGYAFVSEVQVPSGGSGKTVAAVPIGGTRPGLTNIAQNPQLTSQVAAILGWGGAPYVPHRQVEGVDLTNGGFSSPGAPVNSRQAGTSYTIPILRPPG